jgi:predicted ATPase/DNA-binding XRE family transcriptional regulator
MYDDMVFGQRVKQYRKDLDLTQEDFAQRVGISTETVSKIERGERRPSRHVAERMAQVLELAPEDRLIFVRAARMLLSDGPHAGEAPAPPTQTSAPEPVLMSAPQRPRLNLPVPSTPLIGRAAELDELARLLGDPSCRLLTVSGPGGIGKTRLALEATGRQSAAFADGAAFVSLGPVGAPDLLAPAVADALGFSFYGQANLNGQLVDFLREKELLLLLDNFEHLIDAASTEWSIPVATDSAHGAELLVDILQQAPRVKLIVTSRERLNLQGEWVVELQGLPVPRSEQAADFDETGAVALFLQTARRSSAGFTLGPADRGAVARICRLVEGMPLAIELAAAWVRVLPLGEIADEIERTLDFLAASARDLPARHRSLRAVFDHSWNLLTDEERAVFRMLSIFRGGFRREAAEWIAGATLTLLTALVDKSLLRRSGAGRYDMHELVRQYAAAHLEASAEEYAVARARHAGYYLTLIQRRENDIKRARQRAVIDEVVAEIDNLRLAWDWAAAHEQLAELGGAVRGLSWFYELRSWFQEGEQMLERAVKAISGAQLLSDRETERAILLGQLKTFEGWFRFRQGHYGSARELLLESVSLLRPLGDQSALADALASLGMALNLMGDYQPAREVLQEGLALGRALGDNWVIILSLGTLGMVAHGLGEYQEAERLCRESLTLSLALGSVRALVFSISALTMAAFAQGQYSEAQALVRTSFATSSAVGDYWGIGSALLQLGRVAYAQGEYAEAQYMFRESCATFREIGDRWSMARALTSLADTLAALGERSAALGAFRDAWLMATEAQVMPVAMEALAGLAELLVNDGAIQIVHQLIGYILNAPAAGQAARDRAERVRGRMVAAPRQQAIDPASNDFSSLEQLLGAVFLPGSGQYLSESPKKLAQ